MGSNARSGVVRGAVLIWCVAAACSPPDFDPSRVPGRAPASASLREQPLLPACAELDPTSAPAAPVAETAPEPDVARAVTVAIGQSASSACGAAVLERAFAEALPAFGVATSTGSDRDAIELLLQGRVDFALAAHDLSARDRAAGLCTTRLGVELWALAASESAPLRSLTRAQMRKVLTAEASTWVDLGQNGGALAVYVPLERDLAERAARTLIPGDPFAAACTALGEQALAQALRNPGAIGVVRVGQPLPAGVRLLQIDWSPATLEAFGIGTYPFGAPLMLVTAGEPAGAARELAAFLRSAPGRELLGAHVLPAK